MLQVATNVRQVYLECPAPFQEDNVHIWAFIYDFLVDYFQLLRRWASRTKAEVGAWEDLTPEGKRERAQALFERRIPAEWMVPKCPPFPACGGGGGIRSEATRKDEGLSTRPRQEIGPVPIAHFDRLRHNIL
jgi:hypothetical protein